MRTITYPLLKAGLLLCLLLCRKAEAIGQGRVVVNEFMAWSGCTTTSEFIELMNFGPGPMDISCYIVTNGQYAVTIPPGTILKPGQYYLLAGQDELLKDCKSTSSPIKVDLNWSTCNCTDKPVPTTGNGFMADGGNANEKVILLDPRLNVVDAVSRYANFSASSLITTAASSNCVGHTFDLDNMAIRYESIDNSTGIDNSFARKVDGDCGWVKTPAISPGSANNTGSTSSAAYSFSTVSASDCNNSTGSVSIQVSASNVGALFPMNYTLGFDGDKNGVFNETDQYTYGVDSSAPSIDINNLAYGRYSMTVGSAMGCNLQTFNFFIFNCYGVALPLKLLAFSHVKTENGYHVMDYGLIGSENVKHIYIEGGMGTSFQTIDVIQPGEPYSGNKYRFQIPVGAHSSYRLRIVDQNDKVIYSPIVKVSPVDYYNGKIWPNPATANVSFQVAFTRAQKLSYTIVNAMGTEIAKGNVDGRAGINTIHLSVGSLPVGMYQVNISGTEQNILRTFRFMKH